VRYSGPVVKVQFADFAIDSASRQLTREGRLVPLSPKAFDVLWLLLAERPNLVAKSALLDRVWPETAAVGDANLTVTVADLRRALGDDPRQPRFIRTVHGFGYSFCGEASEWPADPARVAGAAPRDVAPSVVLSWSDQSRRLADGTHVIGRDAGCVVWLDVPGVSRRHARIVVSGRSATIEDLASTNGTFVDDAPVVGVQELLDGQRIHFGPLEVRFRLLSSAVPTVKATRPRSGGRR
jgi:DNA-binding winged helix-turn-helix (wHTH) protein